MNKLITAIALVFGIIFVFVGLIFVLMQTDNTKEQIQVVVQPNKKPIQFSCHKLGEAGEERWYLIEFNYKDSKHVFLHSSGMQSETTVKIGEFGVELEGN